VCMARYRLLATLTLGVILMSKPAKGLITAEVDAAMGELRARVAGRRPKGRYYLIVCEGTKTEPNYFDAFRSHLSGGEGDKVVVVGAQDNTLGLVERAKAEIAARNESDNPPFYHVWLVFDKDSFPDDDFDNTIVVTRQEDEKFGMDGGILRPHWHSAWSNEAFELWYLFHFQENTGGAISREEYKDRLSKHLGFQYQKNAPNMFEILLPRMSVAIERAERAFRRWPDDEPFHSRNPATAVYELVRNLLMYI